MILCHVAGPSGSGKTTLARGLLEYPGLTVCDLDDQDDQAMSLLGWVRVSKKDYSRAMIQKLTAQRQALLEERLQEASSSIVLVGHHWEGAHRLEIPTRQRFLLDVPAEEAARRAYWRSQGESPDERRLWSELPEDIQQAREDVARLRWEGYQPRSTERLLEGILQQLS